MSAFSLHCLGFACLPCWRSQLRRPNSPSTESHDRIAISADSPRLGVSPTSSFHSSSGLGTPEQGVQAFTGTSCLPSPNARRGPLIGQEPDDFDSEPSRPVSRANSLATSSSPKVPNSYASNPQPQQQQPSGQNAPQPQQYPGMFNQAHNFTVTGTFIENYAADNTHASDRFMEKLLDKTITGASFDSSARDPPPRCHPGTRLAILERCLQFIATCSGQTKMRWVVGAAGVGKSAIMQSVAESSELRVDFHASVFFSINGRNDGNKAIITLSYQLAAKSEPYRHVIEYEIARNPSILQSSMPVQFIRLIVEPFIHRPQLSSVGRVLIIIDGLDECSDPRTQQELLRLISEFCLAYPSSPLVWLIASRPETHITSFFSRTGVALAYEKEEILIDSDEARADVERYLRTELMEIKTAWGLPNSQWPKEQDLWKILSAAGGLFAYARTIIRYISDPKIGSPVLQLSDVLDAIDKLPMTGLSPEEHPMALLDDLYARILSKVPLKIMTYTRKLLLALVSDWDQTSRRPNGVRGSFIVLCNWLGMTPDEAYAAVNHLYSVLYVPARDTAGHEKLEPFHKSFIDYISDFSRSGFCRDIEHEARQLMNQCAVRILNEAPDGVDFPDLKYECLYGILKRGPGTGRKVSLTWLVDQASTRSDDMTRLQMYKLAIETVVAGIAVGDSTFLNVSYIRSLTTGFEEYDHHMFPRGRIRDLVFDASRRNEFMANGLLRNITFGTSDFFKIARVKLHFCRPATTVTNLSNPWNSSCEHQREGEWEDGKDMDWITTFDNGCFTCFPRFQRQFNTWRTNFPDYTLTILFTSAEDLCIEFQFVDSEDGISEWTYQYWSTFSLERRKQYGISV